MRPLLFSPGDAPIKPLRKLLSILLLAGFGLALLSPLLALGQDAETGLHACCRRNGKHQCMLAGGAQRQLASNGSQPASDPSLFRAPVETCPFCPPAVTASHLQTFVAPVALRIVSDVVSHPLGVAQAQCKWRIARDRSRQKRGPPAPVLS